MTPAELTHEFDRQITVLIERNYLQHSGADEAVFRALLAPLGEKAMTLQVGASDVEIGKLPFVIAVKSELVAADIQMAAVSKDGRHGVSKLFPRSAADFHTTADTVLPHNPAYLIVDIDRGQQNRNLPPNEALILIKDQARLALTIEEGIAIATQFPDFLRKNNCYSLLASRHAGDQRVPAIWINAARQPNLGWCWDGNPHTWLGSASCASRIG
ncbi:DUF5701 family protein [Sphingomonas sp. ERG5]|uniref:DUF5701 family protein n=1 Tax=Sphingomonas sp. ERG5 TaxID=1381597 RepID=UPI00054B2778|nr:DUF5701 family protein [Sphingomonas sp. ERG5]